MIAVFRVLGPLSAESHESLTLRAPMLRRLLAALLSRPNETVFAKDLMKVLWGERFPPSARKTLQVYVRRLRSALGDSPRIFHEFGGYRLEVTASELDSLRFTGLVAAAEGADPERTVVLLQQALELWRGTAFEDVRDYAPVAEEARRLDEERLKAESRYVELGIELGRHAEIVPYLAKLIEAYPYREDLRAHMMLALYRSGRQSEALDLFRATRELLADELAVEPGPLLQRMHESILRTDPALDRTESPKSTVPRELPADIAGFAGRDEHLQALNAMLHNPSPVIISAIHGSAGVGKTALAVHWAHRVADRFPDGQIYVNLRGFDPGGSPMSTPDALRRLLVAFGVTPQRMPVDMDAQAALLRSLLAGKRVLLVLDNARDAEQVRPLLPGSPNCLVLLTSRSQMTSLVATNGARPLLLDILTPHEAKQLLAMRLGTDRVAAEPEATEAILARCAGLPLALSIAAARTATHPGLSLADLAQELQVARRGLDAFRGDDPITDIRAVFFWSYRRLSAPAARLFRLLGLHPGPDASAAVAASLAALPPARVSQLLAELMRAHLISLSAAGRYTFHDLLRAYAAELAEQNDSGAERHAATRRMLDHYLHTAYQANRLIEPFRTQIAMDDPASGVTLEELADPHAARAWLATEHPVLVAVTTRASTGFAGHTWRLAWVLSTFLDWQGHWRDLEATHRLALGATQSPDLDEYGHAYAHHGLARAAAAQGNYESALAYLQNALAWYGRAGHQKAQGNTCLAMAFVLRHLGRDEEATQTIVRALEVFKSAGHRAGQAAALNAIAQQHLRAGQPELALQSCQQALALNEGLDVGVKADTWSSLGSTQHELGRYDEAAQAYASALDIYQAQGNRYYEARTHQSLGDTHAAAGDPDAARKAWETALTILSELDHPEAHALRSKLEHQ